MEILQGLVEFLLFGLVEVLKCDFLGGDLNVLETILGRLDLLCDSLTKEVLCEM